ncbi:uncharacterized protein LOC121974526 isoform X2 [Zingiber officinale]|uniref:uncharacterized protein LOC121974526 isoform X2 n=1 Tax=Zingiber officinale TaxID=94328 RepID=UPI001C4AB969|nr:uncharacterized protein LOC121974526 isoform X2 [Zingiber officinale]
MMFPGGAPPGDHQETLPLPPLPSPSLSPPSLTPRALLHPSYSSTLSALAPPFTLDHVSPTPPLAPQLPPHPPDSLLFPDFPTSRLLPHNDVAESLPSRFGSATPCVPNSGRRVRVQSLVGTNGPTFYSEFAAPSRTGSAADVEPYYAHYYPDSQRWALDDLFGSSSAYSKLNSALLIKPVDEEAKRVKRTNEVPLTEVTEPPFRYKGPSFQEDSLLAYHTSTSQLPPHNTAAEMLPSGSVSTPFGHSYYPHYHHVSELQALIDSCGTSLAHSELGPAQWNKPSLEEMGRVKHADGVTRMGPNSSHTLSFQEGKEQFGSRSIEWLLDDHPPEKYEQDNASSYTIFNPQLSTAATGSTSAMGLHDTYISNSAYDRYMAQLDSCSMYPIIFYSSTACSTSTESYAPSNSTTSTNINPTLSSVKVHHEVLHKVDDPSVIPSRSKEVNLHKNMDPKEGYDERIWEDYNTTNSNVLPASSIRDSLPNNNHATENPSNLPSMLTSKLRLGNVVIADSSPSNCNSLDLNKSTKSSSEAFDQLNLAVDSPCWKGAPASQQFPFTIDETLAVEYESFKNDSCHEHNQILGVGNSNNSAEQVGNLNFDDIKISPASEQSECSPAVSSSIQQISEGAERKLSGGRKDQENEIWFDYTPREQTRQTNEAEKTANVQNVFPAKFVETESNTASNFLPAKGVNENIDTLSGPPLKRMEELVKLIHGSSVELLSTNSRWSKELKPHDYKLLYAAINNIALLLRDKEDIVGFCHCSSVRIACSCIKCLKARDLKRNNNIQNCNVKGMTLSGCNFSNDEFDNFVVKGGDAYLSKVDKRMTQTIENALSQSFTETDDSRQASLYKNLWLQAEVLACRLKQELLIAQMKTESESYKPPQSNISSSLHSPRDLKVQDSPLKPKDIEGITEQESQFSATANHESSKAEDVESSVMARFKILKDRDNNSVYRSTEAEYILDQESAARHTAENATKNNPGMIANLADIGLINSVANDEARPSLHVSGYEDASQMLPGPLNGSLIQSYMAHKQGSWPSTTEDYVHKQGSWPSTTEDYVHKQGSWPFEWEHVMREDEDESTH